MIDYMEINAEHLYDFLDNFLVFGPGERCEFRDIWQSYEAYVKAVGAIKLSSTAIGRAVNARGAITKSSNGVIYKWGVAPRWDALVALLERTRGKKTKITSRLRIS